MTTYFISPQTAQLPLQFSSVNEQRALFCVPLCVTVTQLFWLIFYSSNIALRTRYIAQSCCLKWQNGTEPHSVLVYVVDFSIQNRLVAVQFVLDCIMLIPLVIGHFVIKKVCIQVFIDVLLLCISFLLINRYLPSVLWRCCFGGRKGIWPVKTEWWGVGMWLSVWSEVQTCIWPYWCHCHSLSLASVKSRLVLPFWYWLTRVIPVKGLLNGCVWLTGI